MSELTVVSETLYVPLLGRIYASKHHPDIFYDDKDLSISDLLPTTVNEISGQTEYTLLASAIRSKNMDHYLQRFLGKNPDGVIVNLGCGLETTYYRNDNGKALWFELDLPDVLDLRSRYFPAEERDRYLPYSMFDYTWIDIVKEATQKPVLIIASGLFYYFHEEQVVDFLKHLTCFENVQLIFDAVSSGGIKFTKHYMKKMDKQDAEMFFSVDNAKELAAKISPDVTVVEERKFYSLSGFDSEMEFATKLKMYFSDLFNMVKMVHMKMNVNAK